jgi:hypothetical protein
MVEGADGNRTRQAVVTRAAVALLYAHWEGFVKAAAEIYLQFVAMQRCRNSELTDSMLAIVLRSKFLAAERSKKITIHTTVVEFFRTQMQRQCSLPYKDVVSTEANLSSTVFLEILHCLGLSPADYESKSHLIDSQPVGEAESHRARERLECGDQGLFDAPRRDSEPDVSLSKSDRECCGYSGLPASRRSHRAQLTLES